MEISVENISSLERKMTVMLPASRVKEEADKILQNYGQRARLDGFRPGKVPKAVLQQRFGASAQQEALSEVIQKAWPEAVDQEGVRPAGYPKIDLVEPSVADGEAEQFGFTAVFEVYPQIELQSLSGMGVDKPTVEIVEGDVDDALESLLQRGRTWEATDRAAAEGDQVSIDFVGSIDGELFDGGSGEDISLELGAGQFLKELEDGIVGQAAGEERDISVTFPDEYQAESLQGKTANFKTTVKEVRESVLPKADDEEFLKTAGITEGGVEALRAQLKDSLERERDNRVDEKLKEQVFDALYEKHPIDIPHNLIHEEVHSMQHQAADSMGMGHKGHEEVHKMFPEDMFKDRAKKRVSLGLTLAEVIKARNIELDDSDVDAELERMAAGFGDPEQFKNYYRSNPQNMESIRSRILETQVMQSLLSEMTINEQSMSYADLVKAGQPEPAEA